MIVRRWWWIFIVLRNMTKQIGSTLMGWYSVRRIISRLLYSGNWVIYFHLCGLCPLMLKVRELISRALRGWGWMHFGGERREEENLKIGEVELGEAWERGEREGRARICSTRIFASLFNRHSLHDVCKINISSENLGMTWSLCTIRETETQFGQLFLILKFVVPIIECTHKHTG